MHFYDFRMVFSCTCVSSDTISSAINIDFFSFVDVSSILPFSAPLFLIFSLYVLLFFLFLSSSFYFSLSLSFSPSLFLFFFPSLSIPPSVSISLSSLYSSSSSKCWDSERDDDGWTNGNKLTGKWMRTTGQLDIEVDRKIKKRQTDRRTFSVYVTFSLAATEQNKKREVAYAVQRSRINYSTAQCNTVKSTVVLYCTVQYRPIHYRRQQRTTIIFIDTRTQ